MKLISRARRTPIACGSSTVSPQPGITPTRVCVSPKRARSDATRKSQLSASSNPPVIAGPLTAPITGFSIGGNGPPECVASVGVAAEVAAGRSELLEVEARAERRISAGEDHHVDVVTTVGLAEQLGQEPQHLGGQRVAGGGPVERHRRDAIADLEQHRAFRHGSTSSSSGGRNSSLRSPSRTSVDAIHPPIALKWSSRIEPSASGSSVTS